MMACVTGWFDTHRSLAVSLVSAGMGMAPMTMSPLAAWLVSRYDWRTALLIIAAVVAAVMIPAALAGAPPAGARAGHAGAAADGARRRDDASREALRSPQFIILLLTNFFCCATHSGPIFHTVSYAVTCGIPLIAAVRSTASRASPAWAAGSPSACSATGSAPSACWSRPAGAGVRRARLLFVAQISASSMRSAALFGFIYAGVMPLYAVIARENFPLRMMGTVIGGTAMAGSLGMATGPLAGGLIYDAFASYAWLYIGSWAWASARS